MKSEQSIFVRRLTQLMEEYDLTQIELAEKIGTTNVTISRYLSGERKPRVEIVAKLAKELNTTVDFLLGNSDVISKENILEAMSKAIPYKPRRLPVLGVVKAGYNYLAQENILEYIDPAMDLPDSQEYFSLIVKGNSMSPMIDEGDYLIVKKEDGNFINNDICIVLINGDEATVKKVVRTDTGIELHAANPYYPIQQYTFKEVQEKPVRVIGTVIRQIRKFK